MVIAGHRPAEAAKLLRIAEVPTVLLENLSADQIRAYALADNRLAEKAGWDESILAIELQHLLTVDTDFDVTITGFEIPEIDLPLSATSNKPDPDDSFVMSNSSETTLQPGSLWQLGRHRILCASSIEQSSFSRLLGTKRAGVVFVDPPYNVPASAQVSL